MAVDAQRAQLQPAGGAAAHQAADGEHGGDELAHDGADGHAGHAHFKDDDEEQIEPHVDDAAAEEEKSGRLVSPMARSMPAPKSYTISAGIPAKTMRI